MILKLKTLNQAKELYLYYLDINILNKIEKSLLKAVIMQNCELIKKVKYYNNYI